ncbi:LutC/YkgG family protein [Virgibacillus sp. W0181]|uniref:LutC/YkgG family protein n=1 Tax=Virgibacillus sp. W0181 TaxID=3391581 RepID=UPI003F4625EC
MTIKNRSSFLDHVAKNLGRSPRTNQVKKPLWTVAPQWEVYKNYSIDNLVSVLEEQCKAIHTDFRKTPMTDLPAVIKEIIQQYDGNSIIAAEDARNEQYGLTKVFQELKQHGKEMHVWDPKLGKDNQIIAERADVGITFSDITLAESGTVTLLNNENNARTISLLPEAYIAIIPKSTLVPRLTQAAKQLHENVQQGENTPSCISFISGPSNSADIEMNLIVGVHGPVKTAYIVVD